MTAPRYFTVAERLAQQPVSSIEPMPSPSMYDELLSPLWLTPDQTIDYLGVLPCGCVPPCEGHADEE